MHEAMAEARCEAMGEAVGEAMYIAMHEATREATGDLVNGASCLVVNGGTLLALTVVKMSHHIMISNQFTE